MSARLLELDDLTAAQVEEVLDLATAWKAAPDEVPAVLGGTGAVALFEKPSARTRIAFELAVSTLGGHPVVLRGEDVGLGVRESVEDVARTFAAFTELVAARVHDHGALEAMDAAVGVPVVNLLSDRAHPTQALADLLTLRERFGSLEGRRVAFVGDGNNVAASLAFGAALCGLECVVASPPGYELPEALVEQVRNLGGTLELTDQPPDAVAGADAVYCDVWTSMGQEEEAATRREAFAAFRVDDELLALAAPEAVLLHCLPAHRGEEITAAALDGPRAVVWEQAANRMHAMRAAFVVLSEAR